MKIYLDQNILSNLAKCFVPHETEGFLKFLRKNDAQIVLSAAHVWETAKAHKKIQDLIIHLVNKVDYIYVTSAAAIMALELRSAFQTFLSVSPSEVTPFGYIFHSSDNYVPFSSQVNYASERLGAISEMDLFIDKEFMRIQSERIKSKRNKELQKDLDFELKELLKYFLGIREIWAKPAVIELDAAFIKKQSEKFIDRFDPATCPVLDLYVKFQTLKFRNLKIGKYNYKIYDTEHATIEAYYCDYLICEKNMAEILTQINNIPLIKAKIYKSMSDFLDENKTQLS